MKTSNYKDIEYLSGIGWMTDVIMEKPIPRRPGFVLDTKKFLTPMDMEDWERLYDENEALTMALIEIANQKLITLNTVEDVLKLLGTTKENLSHETVKEFISNEEIN